MMRTQLSSSRQLLNMVVKHGDSVFKAHGEKGKLAVRRKRTRWNGMLDAVEGLEVLEARQGGDGGHIGREVRLGGGLELGDLGIACGPPRCFTLDRGDGFGCFLGSDEAVNLSTRHATRVEFQ